MAKVKATSSSKSSVARQRPALTPEAREAQLVSLAVDLAEQQLREGTASSQVISHYLKQSTAKAQLELEKLRLENELAKAKTEHLQSQKRVEELYADALKAMRNYNGQGEPDEY